MQGLVAGSARSAADLLAANVEALRRNNTVRWAYFSPSVQVPPLFGKNKDFKIYGN
jgi:putative NADH-flavin reductase